MITQITLGGYALTTNQVFLNAIRNGSFPATVYTKSKRGGYQGSKLVTPTFASYSLVMEFTIVGQSFSDLTTQRFNFFEILGLIHSVGSETLIITRSNGVGVQTDIKAVSVTGDLTKDDGLSCNVQVTLETEYPFLVGTSAYSDQVLINNGGGFAIPFAIPFAMNVNQSQAVTVTNLGNYSAFPIFTFTGPLTNPSIGNNTTGKTLSVAYTLTDLSKTLTVDCYNRTAVFQDGNNARQYVSGDFWTIPFGTSTVTLGNSNGTDSGNCTISYRDTFLNI